MQPKKALEIWRKACEKYNIRWCLYKETLLCEMTLNGFHPDLEYGHVAVCEDDIEIIKSKVVPFFDLSDIILTKEKDNESLLKCQDEIILSISLIKSESLQTEEKEYPILKDWKSYLLENYGDYENGMSDEVGVGLTQEEKIELIRHQKKSLEALEFLKKTADENGLTYYLLAGSVLGCVRHYGWIPWDDDIDVGIRIEDIDIFEKVLKEKIKTDLPEGFTLEVAEADRNYPRMFSKICYKGRCCIDLWPLVPTYYQGIKPKLVWYFGKMIAKMHYYKIGLRNLKFLPIVRFLCLFLTDKKIMKLSKHNERRFVKDNAPAYINLYSVYSMRKETIDRNWLDESVTMNFEGIEVPVVGHTHEYLSQLYGDYMKLPPPWNRGSRHTELF